MSHVFTALSHRTCHTVGTQEMFDEEGRKRKNEKGGPVVTTLKTK